MSRKAPAISGFSSLAIDATNPAVVGRFWADLLDASVEQPSEGQTIVSTRDGLRIDFLAVPEPKSVKNRLHIDLAARDVAEATRQALALGASLADDVYDGGRWQVLRDPEGNEFCLLPPGLN